MIYSNSSAQVLELNTRTKREKNIESNQSELIFLPDNTRIRLSQKPNLDLKSQNWQTLMVC